MCEWKPDFESLNTRVEGMETRLTQVEHDVGKMRSESQDGFRAINASIANLAHDFGNRMNSMDSRLVEEKTKWGETFRTIVKWIAALLVAGCATAMGVSAYKSIFAMGGS